MRSPEKFLGDGARLLAKVEGGKLIKDLQFFVDHWGLDAYTPPEHVEMRVREIVKAFVIAGRMIQEEQENG